MRVAFIVGEFPVVSETFIINQVADLIDRGIEVQIFSLKTGSAENVSERFFTYRMDTITRYLNPPKTRLQKIFSLPALVLTLLIANPRVLFRALNQKKYGLFARSFRTLFWVKPFIGKKFDLVHCHFGTIGKKYLIVRDILGETTPFVTSLYGYDVSHIPQQKSPGYYASLIEACSKFFVMSENMKNRAIKLGFPEEKILVHPVSVDVNSYPFSERVYEEDSPIQIVSVGRFVEKKGFDDLLRAIALVKKKSKKKFRLSIVGDGPLREEIFALAKNLEIENIVDFKGYMKLQDVIDLYTKSHLYVQASKTAKNGDME